LHHASGGDEHREWDSKGCDEGCPDVAEEEEEDGDDEKRPLGEVFRNSANDGIDELGAV
jgi:hypothetical protein